jgi:hypothetical protein
MDESTRDKEIKLFPITGEYLREIFRDKEFVRNIKKVNKIKDYECGFITYKYPIGRDYLFNSVKIGGCGEINWGSADDLEKSDEVDSDFYGCYRLMDLHSHPGNSAMPSYPYEVGIAEDGSEVGYGDLTNLFENKKMLRDDEGINIKPIKIIMPLYENKIIDLLVFQEKPVFVVNLEELVERADEFDKISLIEHDVEGVAYCLEETGWYNACVVRYEKGRYKGLENLDKFAFVPLVADRKKFLDFAID